MVASILGRFMVKTGKMSQEQYQQILDAQDKVRVRMGLMAVSEGLLTVEQADEINKQQAVMDKRFGDIAIEQGYLTKEQVGNLLKMQGNEYLTFVQNVVDAGILDMEEMNACLKAFQQENNFTNSNMEALKSADLDKIVEIYLPLEALVYQDIIGVAVRTVFRCIDRFVYIEEAMMTNRIQIEGMVSQTMEGTPSIQTCFAEAEGGLVKLAATYAQEQMQDMDEEVLDAAGELLNCINGLYASAKSREGISLELLPPVYQQEAGKAEAEELCVLPIYVKNKKLFFIVSNKAAF